MSMSPLVAALMNTQHPGFFQPPSPLASAAAHPRQPFPSVREPGGFNNKPAQWDQYLRWLQLAAQQDSR